MLYIENNSTRDNSLLSKTDILSNNWKKLFAVVIVENDSYISRFIGPGSGELLTFSGSTNSDSITIAALPLTRTDG